MSHCKIYISPIFFEMPFFWLKRVLENKLTCVDTNLTKRQTGCKQYISRSFLFNPLESRDALFCTRFRAFPASAS